jgi:hypothetical protein
VPNYDADNVFFETDDLGIVCIGGAPFGYTLTVTRIGGFEVWDSVTRWNGKCIAGEGYAGASEIRIAGTTVFQRDAIKDGDGER